MLAHRVNNIIPWKDEGDIHLCILFTEGDAWGDFRVFRSNRLYINHDVLNV